MPYPGLRPPAGKKWGKHTKHHPIRPHTKMPADLGGLTFPQITGLRHMGPGNLVWPYPVKGPDEKYRQHDLGYEKITNPYWNFNAADKQLLRTPIDSIWDYVAKGIFTVKEAIDILNTPSLFQGGYYAPKKEVYSQLDNSVGVYDAADVPFREFDSAGTYDASAVPFREFTPSENIARRKEFGWYDPTGRSEWSAVNQGQGSPLPDWMEDWGRPTSTADTGIPAVPSVPRARVGSRRKHSYIATYDFSN